MKTAVIYARYSSDSQTEQSIEGQLRVCEEYAQRNEIAILDTYIDRAMSGTNDNRPDFQKLIRECVNHNWQYVIVYKIDRFSRNKYEMAKYKKILKDNGVKLLSAMENIPDTPEGIILESLLEGMAEYYSAELAQKVKRGMHETRIKGLSQGGILPYGYKLDGRKIVIDEASADVVKYIFKQYAMGKFVSSIIYSLTSKGIYKRGKPFPPNTIYGILKNEKYTGVYKINNETYTNMFPKIIDEDIFEKAQRKTNMNKTGRINHKNIYLLKDKLICGYCGKSISAECGITRFGKKMNYYKCIGIKKYRNGCPKETIKQEILEEFILNTITKELSKPNVLNAITQSIINLQSNPSQNETLVMLEKNKRQVESQLNYILQAIESGIINKTTNNRMKELEKQLDDIEIQIQKEKNKAYSILTEEEIKNYYKDALRQEPLALIDILVKQIKVYNDKIEITFNCPPIKSCEPNHNSFFTLTTQMKKIIQHRPLPEYVEINVYFNL